MLILNSSVV